MDNILEMANLLSEGSLPMNLKKDIDGYYLNVSNSLYGVFNESELLQKLSDLEVTYKGTSDYTLMSDIANESGDVWIRVDKSKLGALVNNRLSEGVFTAYDNYDDYFVGVVGGVSYETETSIVTVADTYEGTSIVSISENDEVYEFEFDSHDLAMDEAHKFIRLSSLEQQDFIESVLNEQLSGGQMRALFAKGYLKKNNKTGKMKYSKTAFKKGRRKGQKDSKPRLKAGESPNYERNKAYRQRMKIKKDRAKDRTDEMFSDLVQLKGDEYEANNPGAEDRYGTVNKVIGVKGLQPIKSKKEKNESTEASAIPSKVSGGTNTKKIIKKRDL